MGGGMNEELKKFDEDLILNMTKDTSDLLAQQHANYLNGIGGATLANKFTNEVEMWQWFHRNFTKENGGMFQNPKALKEYMSKGKGKVDWVAKQVQGKGYEWDWMLKERGKLENLFCRFEAGDLSNQVGIDVTKTNLLTGKQTTYQHKSNASKSNPKLNNTTKDTIVVVGEEKVKVVQDKGYQTERFKTSNEIKKDTSERMAKAKNGQANMGYNWKNVGGAMVKAGAVGAVVGVTVETISSYQAWKSCQLTTEEYLKEIAKSGGNSGVTGAIAGGIMVPITAHITLAGLSSLIPIPISFAVAVGVDSLVAPAFGRGKYKVYLNEAQYYNNLQDFHRSFVETLEDTTILYMQLLEESARQQEIFTQNFDKSRELDVKLGNLYNSI